MHAAARQVNRAPALRLDPRDGYCRFMHASWQSARCDAVHDGMFGRARVDAWGGECGPYLIGPYTTGEPGRATIYWTMSTWNRYQVVLMRSTIARTSSPHRGEGRGEGAA